MSDTTTGFPVRPHQGVTPLIDASAAFPAMERLVLGARSHCYFGFRIFDPTTRLRSPEAADRGLWDWRDLIAAKLAEDVRFRFLTADFDPLGGFELHAVAWRNARAFTTIAPEGDDQLQVLVALHEGEIGPVPRVIFWPFAHLRLSHLLHRDADAPSKGPGLARLVRHDDRGSRPRRRPPRLWPATHHQKMLVVDGERAIVGGLDVDERRFDDKRHDRPADETWHDVSLLLEGTVARDVEDHFVDVWNREVRRHDGRGHGRPPLTDGYPHGWSRPTALHGAGANRAAGTATASSVRGHGSSTLRLARTASVRSSHPAAMLATNRHREIEAQLIEIIGAAKTFLYIENQFVRHWPIVQALLGALRDEPALELTIVVPMAPDTVAFDGRSGFDQRYAEFLQTRALGRLMRASSDRVGVFAPVGARTPNGDASSPRATAFGRGIIYLHSKVMIADDEVAHVSSANLNGRSMHMDTELGVEWRDPDGVAQFRSDLWRMHLGEDALAGPNRPRLADWRRLANEALHDRDRELPQRVVPYHLARARRFSRYAIGIPEEFF